MLVCPSVQTGGAMSYTAFQAAWRSYQHYLNIAAGGKDASRSNPKIQAVEPFTAHQLRHTYATMLYDAGVDVLTVQRLLGHADVQATMRIYTHLSKQKEQQSIAALNAHIGSEIAAIKF
jgi:integrase